jgi:hypothetical protein
MNKSGFDDFMTLAVGVPSVVCVILFSVGMLVLWDSLFMEKKEGVSIPPIWAGVTLLLMATVLGIYLWTDYLPSLYGIYRQQMRM